MLSKDLELSLNLAFIDARRKCHEYITVEHLLLALCDNPDAVGVLSACGVKIGDLKSEISTFLEENTPSVEPDKVADIQPTLGFQRVLQRAVYHVQSAGNREVTGANVLVAIFSEKDSHAVYLLGRQDVVRLDVVNHLSHGMSKLTHKLSEEEAGATDASEEDHVGSSASDVTQSLLEKYTVNLNQLALKGKIDPLIGRDEEIERTLQVLCRRRKNNPLYVGEAGVGKTAIAEGLALMIVEKRVPSLLQGSCIYALDIGSLLAGTKYRGDFEKRLKGLIAKLSESAGNILFIDEIHTIIGAGSTSGGTMDASNLMKPLLSSGELRCLGSTTYQEYRGIFEKDRALARRFQKIDVLEPSVPDTIKILEGLRSRFEDFHQVHYTRGALKLASELSDRYIHDRHLPDKAIDVIDEAGAALRLKSFRKVIRRKVSVRDIEVIVAKMAKIPVQSVNASELSKLDTLHSDMAPVVFGQDEAISSLTSAIKMSRAGLGDVEKPVGSFLFSGPTGVGKTEVCRQLAKIMGVELIRFDMSEYMERHTVSRLIGAPPGYVGYDQGGLMTEAVNKTPHAVLLLDEIEKAHPDVFNLLLQVMDHGSLTDNNGRKADFRNVILIMTTNAGAERMARSSIGFVTQDHTHDGGKELQKTFTPEFRNRLSAIIQFHQLVQSDVIHVVDKFLFELESQLEAKKVSFCVTQEARNWLAEQGYDEKMGARPMSRLIQEKIRKKLADELLFGELSRGGEVLVSLENQELTFTFNES